MNSLPRRRGFTLLEVAFVVVVGMMIVAGVYYGYVINKDQAGNSIARERLYGARATLEAYAAAHDGQYPASGDGHFAKAWADAHPQERNASPWGGPTGGDGMGAVEDSPIASGAETASDALDVTASFERDETRHGNLHYVQVLDNRWVKVTTSVSGESRPFKGYVLGIYDRQGNPFLDAIGGN